ncbi:MAG TPA: hypothetical protein VLH12_01520 [Usitatibacter sp.]|nr:hypothetical protein [Usitatibacter sp.]
MSAIPMTRITTRQQLDGALARRKTMSHLRLGDALVQEKLITTGQRDAALAVQAGDHRMLLGEILVGEGAITREKLRQVLAEQLGVPTVNLAQFECDRDAIDAVAPDLARRHLVMPLYRTASRIAVGIENPLSWEALQELERSTQLKIDPAMASREDLVASIARAYGAGAALGHLPCAAAEAPIQIPTALPANEDLAAGVEPDLLALATSMVKRAWRTGTLSVHAEAVPGIPGALRFRVEGTLDP